MKDRRTLFAFIILIVLVGIVIALSLDKKSLDTGQNKKIESLSSTVESLTLKVSQLQTIKGIDGKTPIKGTDYTDGSNGKDGRDGRSIVGPAGKDGAPGTKGDKGDPAPELDIQCVSNKIMKKYTGDDFWQPTNIKCEVDHE